MKTKEEMIELIQYINVVIQDKSNGYTEQEKIDLIKEYLVDNPEVDIGVSNNEFSSNISLLSADDDLNYPLIVALDTGQLEIADYLLDLKNAISDDMINTMRFGMNFDPLYHLLNSDFELNKVKKIFDKILNLYKAHPNYYENDSIIKLSISNNFDQQISKIYIKEGHAKIAEVINVLLYDNKYILEEEFLHAGKFANYEKAKILLEIDSTVINAKNQDNQNALDLCIKSSGYILDRASQNNFALYYFLRGKGLDHGEASGSFLEKFYNHISFDFDKNPLEVINTIIKMNPIYKEIFNLSDKILNGVVDIATEYDLWMVLKKNQLSACNVNDSVASSKTNEPLSTKLVKEQFDQFGSLKNLALLKLFDNGHPSKQLYVGIKNGLIPQDLVELVINYLTDQTLETNEYGWQLAQEAKTLNMHKEDINMSAIGEQASTESVD